MKTKERVIWILLIVFLLSLIGLIIFNKKFNTISAQTNDYDTLVKVFEEAYNKIMDRFVDVDTLDTEILFYGAMKGMVSSLEDSHSAFFDPEQFKELDEEIEGKFAGIGAYIISKGGYVKVVAPIEGTPAAKAGLKSNDIIIEINGTTAENLSTREASNLIRGEAGTDVTLTIKRPGKSESITITITRAIIEIPVVRYTMINSTIGYIKLISFSHIAPQSVLDAIEELKKQGMKELIFDVRNNLGGALDSGKEITDIFLEKGNIVYTVGRGDEILQTFKAEKNNYDIIDMPLILLVNENSASASEIFAGALKDTQRAFLIGRKTYGKGSVQSFMPLEESLMNKLVGLKITIAHWYTPSGNQIDEEGIEPDFLIEENENEIYDRNFYINKIYDGNYLEKFLEENPDFTRGNIEQLKKQLEEEYILIDINTLGKLAFNEKNRYNINAIVDTEYDVILRKAISVLENNEYNKKEILVFD